MRTLPKRYQCEVCDRIFNNPYEAQDCERRVPETYPVGLIYNNPAPGQIYANMTFCIAKVVSNAHCNDSPIWVCRDTEAGDSLGNCLCGGGNSLVLYKDDVPDPAHPTFKRMVEWLQEFRHDIDITVWDGEEACPWLSTP